MENNLNYIPLLVNFAVALSVGFGMLAVDWLFGPKRPSKNKGLPYECGFNYDQPENFGDRIFVRFIVIAMIFILFDVETIFLYPWAVLLKQLGFSGFVEMLIFASILLFGLYYIVRKGAFEWD
ncbi:MAG TPA: NADH-quinone oxidoreductase subunit A [Candidatus Wallbacteria bacterium]|nr:NADH-quinone oxidoreductase subunit A [Candidatus Wallbacteria bacterium]